RARRSGPPRSRSSARPYRWSSCSVSAPGASCGLAATGGPCASAAEILRIVTAVPSFYALSTNSIDQAIFHVASALEVPVLILALLALALVIYELGSYLIELRGRSHRRF